MDFGPERLDCIKIELSSHAFCYDTKALLFIKARGFMNGHFLRGTASRYLLGVGSVLLLTLLLAQAPISLEVADTALLYLLAVFVIAATFGRWPAIVASLLAFVAFNFFFVAPHFTLTIAAPRDRLSLVTFLVVAVSASGLAGRVRREATRAQERTRELTTLYGLSQAISAEVDLDRILPLVAHTTCSLLRVPHCRILLYDAQGIKVLRAEAGAAPMPVRYVDAVLKVDARVLGVLEVAQRALAETLSTDERAQVDVLASQIVLVVERARLVQEASAARAFAESDRLKSVLLASISHDLRTPLALIKGAVTNLLDDSVAWDDQTRRELLQTANDETDRLNRLVGNLLEMSRIEAGALPHTRTWQDVGELLELVVARLRARLATHPLQVSIAADLPLVAINATQIDQALTNLLENALLHTPPDTPIAVTARRVADTLQVVVEDAGPGIPAGMAPHIFERFVRGTGAERHAAGSGLGLAIARGLVEAHGGRLWATNRPEGGAAFTVALPISQPGASEAATTGTDQPMEQVL
jgi:two-component system sensor histidine kinase KdpD